MSTIIKYFVCETDEYVEPQCPNIFRTSKPVDQVQLKDIKERFLDWKGGFHFYFKTVISPTDNSHVWEDIIDDNQIVPTYNGQIFLKAVRTGFKQFFEIKTRDKDKSVSDGAKEKPQKNKISGAPINKVTKQAVAVASSSAPKGLIIA
jgi:hypothetical protein